MVHRLVHIRRRRMQEGDDWMRHDRKAFPGVLGRIIRC
jgi:hypothetical protein